MRTVLGFASVLLPGLLFFWQQPISIAQVPENLDPNLRIEVSGVEMELIAEHPAVMTPTGIDVDRHGDIWVVVSHTHFRPEQYQGPELDEIVVLSPEGVSQGENAAAKRRVFYNATEATMDLELGEDGWVYLAERDRILRVRDSDGDGRGDQEETIADLQTEADYPHNGLSGLAFDPDGNLLFTLGENYWTQWTLTSTDDRTLEGTGEGGVFRCRPDGSGLERIARGFWNPFGLCVRSDGEIFAAENDPGARPPCRLLHVVPGGDFGYQRLYGNSPYHPFVCWNGELPGTLPMLHAVGEAPCGIVPLGQGLIVPSWTEHRIDFYPLQREGASFQTERITLVSGGDHFRPTCITQVSPTTYYLTDWVYGSYQIHQRGRVWKLQVDPAAASWLPSMELSPANEATKTVRRLREEPTSYALEDLLKLAQSDDSYLRHAAIMAIAERCDSLTPDGVDQLNPDDQHTVLLAMTRSSVDRDTWVRYFWKQDGDEIRFGVLRWIADERLKPFRDLVDAYSRKGDLPFRLFEAALATSTALSDNPRDGIASADRLMQVVIDEAASPVTRAYALRLIDPQDKRFDSDLWMKLLAVDDTALTAEVCRALADRGTIDARSTLRQIAVDRSLAAGVRGDAIAGLSAPGEETVSLLLSLVSSKHRTIREESLRSLRFAKLTAEQRQTLDAVATLFPESSDLVAAVLDPTTLTTDRPAQSELKAWQKRLAKIQTPVDLEAGRRIFHHASIGTCAKCHRHGGRGGVVGPDLTATNTRGDDDRLLAALLLPSRDIDPQYFPRMLLMEDGTVFTGLLLRDGGGGREVYRDNSGKERVFETEQIVQRKELSTSMMPDGLIELMTDREIRDLLAFLDSQ